jgi:hypothetical protein
VIEDDVQTPTYAPIKTVAYDRPERLEVRLTLVEGPDSSNVTH